MTDYISRYLVEAVAEIMVVVVTTIDATDGQVLPKLLEQVEDLIERVSGHGAYD